MHNDEKNIIKQKHKRPKKRYKTVKIKLTGIENELKCCQSWEKQKLQIEHAERLSKEKKAGKSKIKELQDLVLDMRGVMQCQAINNDINETMVQGLNHKIRQLSKSEKSSKDRSVANKAKMKEWKAKHDRLLDALAEEQRRKGDLANKVLQWKETVVSLEEQLMECCDTIYDMTPITIKMFWVQNVGKRGTFIVVCTLMHPSCSLLYALQRVLLCLMHLNCVINRWTHEMASRSR